MGSGEAEFLFALLCGHLYPSCSHPGRVSGWVASLSCLQVLGLRVLSSGQIGHTSVGSPPLINWSVLQVLVSYHLLSQFHLVLPSPGALFRCNCVSVSLVILISVLPDALGMALFMVNIVNLSPILNRALLIIGSGTTGIRCSDGVQLRHSMRIL
jgi:hypothetical protein